MARALRLADVKVGDTVAGQGALKNGVFVPTELGVMDAAMARGRGEGGASGKASGGFCAGCGGNSDAACETDCPLLVTLKTDFCGFG